MNEGGVNRHAPSRTASAHRIRLAQATVRLLRFQLPGGLTPPEAAMARVGACW